MDDVERSIGRLEGKLDSLISTVSSLKQSFDTLEAGRLSALEKQVAQITTKIAIIASGLSVAVSVGWSLFQFFFLK